MEAIERRRRSVGLLRLTSAELLITISEVPDARPRNQYVATVTPRAAALARGDVAPVGRETRDRIVTGAATVVPLLALGVVGSRIARERQAFGYPVGTP